MESPISPGLTRAELEQRVTRFCDAFNRDDLDEVMTYFADDALYATFDGVRARGKAAIRAAFAPQFRGDFGRIRFVTQDLLVDEGSGKAVLRWDCRHELSGPLGGGFAGLRKLFYRLVYGREFGWYGLDVLAFGPDGLLREKHTYAQAKLPRVRRGAGA